MSLFKWNNRRLRQKIEMGKQHRKDDFQNLLRNCCEEAGRTFKEEFGEHPQRESNETANSPAPPVPSDDIPKQTQNLQSEMSDQLNNINTPPSQDNKTGTYVISLFNKAQSKFCLDSPMTVPLFLVD